MLAAIVRIIPAFRKLLAASVTRREEEAIFDLDGQDWDVDVPWRLDQDFED
jgi:hypothetical protein